MSIEITRKGYNIKVLTVVEGNAEVGEYTITKSSDSVEANLLFEILERLKKITEVESSGIMGQAVFFKSKDLQCEHGKGITEYCEPCGRINSNE